VAVRNLEFPKTSSRSNIVIGNKQLNKSNKQQIGSKRSNYVIIINTQPKKTKKNKINRRKKENKINEGVLERG
jgi:hypothetical protein